MANTAQIDNGAVAKLFEGNDLYVIKQGNAGHEFPIEGKATNRVAVVYNSDVAMSSDDREQLNKILAALKLNPDDVGMVNVADVPPPVFTNITRRLSCNYMIVFGATPVDLGMLVAAKRYIELPMQGVKILFSDSIELLRQDAKRKRYLWDCLQVTFGLK